MRLIIADNQEVYREGVKSVLAGFDWVAVAGEASDDIILFDLLESEAVDAVLLDPRISDETDIQIVGRVREQVPEVRVVVVTTLDQGAHVRRAIELGADAYLLRTAGPRELVAALRLVSDGRHYIQAELVEALIQSTGAALDRSHSRLSPQQLRILQMVTRGFKNKQLARDLGMSETTLKSHLRMVYSQLDASNRAEAVATALRLGLVE